MAEFNVTATAKELSAEMGGISKLCDNWPIVKQVLQAIANATQNPFIKMAISVVIAAGDAICGKK